MEISLQAYANVGKRRQCAAVEMQCRVHIYACLHVHPDDGVPLCALNNGLQMFEAQIWREIQTELCQFDGNLRLQALFSDALQNFKVVFRNLLRLGVVLDVFPQISENRSDVFSTQSLSRAKRVIERLAGHEPGHRAAHKGIMCGMVAKPSVLRRSQQQGAHQTHSLFDSFIAEDSTFLPVFHSALDRCQKSPEFRSLSAHIRKLPERGEAVQPARRQSAVQSRELARSSNPSRLSLQSEESRA